MKKLFITSVVLCFLASTVWSQEISPLLFGHNIWLDKLSLNGTYTDVGSMNDLWDDLESGGTQFVRAGGIHYDENIPPNEVYLEWIDEIYAIGAEPMIQISRKSTAQQARDLVTYINVTMNRNVKYWIIGNEPDWHWNVSTPASDPYHVYDAGTIKAYITNISTAIKEVDPSILVVGPECAWMNTNYLGDLIGGAQDITGVDGNGNYYIDVVTYHQYNDPTRAVVESKMNTFLGILNSANVSRPVGHKLTWGITEYNITTDNDKENDRNKAWSFYAGQYFAETYGLAMKHGALTIMPWSVQESGGNRVGFDLGMFDSAPNLEPRSNYHHYHLLANNFSGQYANGTTDQADVTAFGSVDNGVTSVILINKGNASFNYVLSLDENPISGTSELKVNISANLGVTISGSIGANETQLLVFNNQGDLAEKCIYNEEDALAKRWPSCETFNSVQGPYSGNLNLIPGSIEAEEYDLGGAQTAYNDLTEGNEGTVFRTDDVDVQEKVGGGYNVGWIDSGEWLEYSVDVTSADEYNFSFIIASEESGTMHVEMNGQNISSVIAIGSTGGWQVWDTVTVGPYQLNSGEAIMRLYFDEGPFNLDQVIVEKEVVLGNKGVNWLLPVSIYPNPTHGDVTLTSNENWELFDVAGGLKLSGYGNSIPMAGMEKGLYLAKINNQYTRVVLE